MQKIFVAIVVISIPALLFIYGTFKDFNETVIPYSPNASPLKTISIGTLPVRVEVAHTLEERRTGLSGRDFLLPNQGLLFVFEEPDVHGIWMKEMKFPIDILWIDENLKIIDIKKDARPSSFPEIFRSSGPAKYVIELNSGHSEIHGIQVGDIVDL